MTMTSNDSLFASRRSRQGRSQAAKRYFRALAPSAILLLQGCTLFGPPGPPPGGGPALWPPTAAQCVRNNNVPFGSIAAELTRLYADPQCRQQPTCAAWANQEQPQLVGASTGSSEWFGYTSHLFTIAEQDSIIAGAEANAIAHTPARKRFYRLTFRIDIIVANGPTVGAVFAAAGYGRCIADIPHIPDTHNSTDRGERPPGAPS